MGYAETLLTPDEEFVVRERQHWLALLLDSWLAIVLWGATIVLLLAYLLIPDIFGSGTLLGDIGVWIMTVTFIGGVIVLAIRIWWWTTQEFVITSRRLILTWGVLNKHSSDSSLEKINDAILEISLLGRILGYGSLRVLTAAPLEGSDLLNRLNNAKAFKKAMMTAKHQLSSRESDGDDQVARTAKNAASHPDEDVSGRRRIDVSAGDDPLKADTPDEISAVLEQLSELRDVGAISEEDYQAKKQELLGRL
jgi:uncharacterized membrane protein YdbT with pleckstrin-like domain